MLSGLTHLFINKMLRVFLRRWRKASAWPWGHKPSLGIGAFEIDLQRTSARAERAFSKQAINYSFLIGRPFNEAAECGELHLCQQRSHIRVVPITAVATYWTYRTTIMQKDTVALKGAVVLMDASFIKLHSHPLRDLKLLQYVYGKSPVMESTGKNPTAHHFYIYCCSELC